MASVYLGKIIGTFKESETWHMLVTARDAGGQTVLECPESIPARAATSPPRRDGEQYTANLQHPLMFRKIQLGSYSRRVPASRNGTSPSAAMFMDHATCTICISKSSDGILRLKALLQRTVASIQIRLNVRM
eukprot:6198472-Pleurochrysis_carterae.AAC.1